MQRGCQACRPLHPAASHLCADPSADPLLAAVSTCRSNFSDPRIGADPDLLFQPLTPLAVSGGRVSLQARGAESSTAPACRQHPSPFPFPQVNVGDLYTLSTLSTGRHGFYASPPAAPFPVPFADDFDAPGYNASAMPRYWSNLNGGFELADSGDAARGLVLQQRTVAEMVRGRVRAAPMPLGPS